jgi:hypothetical protein
MGRVHKNIDAALADWISRQPVFFVATAPLSGGHVNCSPKGNRGELAVLGPTRVAYLDQTGSGVETIAHLSENGRIVIMFCAFEGPPRIIRLHGAGRAVLRDDPDFPGLAEEFASASGHPATSRAGGPGGVGVRSIVEVEISRVADSCGYGVPLMRFEGHRSTMDEWSDRKGEEGIRAYWREKNAGSLDGLPGVSAAG